MHTSATFELPPLFEFSAIGAENNPNRVAFGEGPDGREVTWREFEDDSLRAADAFRDYIGQGDRVAFLCDCSIDHVTLWNGAMKAGAIVSNLHTRASTETLAYCIDELRPSVLVLDATFSDTLETALADRVSTDLDAVVTIGRTGAPYEESLESFLAGHEPVAPDVRIGEDDVACVQWTSGTTGRPKGWCHTHRGLGHKALLLQDLLHLDRTAAQAHVFTPSFAAWYSLILPALYASAATYFLEDWDAETYVELIESRSITMADLIPTMWQEVLRVDDLEAYDLGSLRRAITSGEALDESTLTGIRERICDSVYNSYAATEVLGTYISDRELEGDRIKSVGKPMSATRIRIVDPGGPPDATKEPGEVGEIIVKGPDCAVWAWNDTEKTEEAFEDGWWFSGDLGYKDDDGYLFVEGRTDFMIKSKGIKVFPTPIEERLLDHPGVAQAVVVGVDDEEFGEKVVAAVRRSDPDVTAEELAEWCLESETVARFERPREFHFLEEAFPRTATEKLDRQSVRDLLEDARE
ncbi:class I adenylate-forming enzyme family protein [Halobellus clavatus]|uniref:AMP-binding enzyme C-terminal domain-containing protein n=1 Tax=Halobellus clavatus TaxID=660517 RepID=A0A1H3FXF6_9EURY|nr:class I adenylate-forming enzyme family protein [Halobellus clavatus]SDX94854.1 AMP-binding enzyme C-terminal domain-containing protein [Halobellus clavatus]